jgi:hypothetical protein
VGILRPKKLKKQMSIKAHQKYFNAKGILIPGVTTVISELGWNTNALVAWARREALNNNDPNKIKEKAGRIGTLCHSLVQCHLTNKKPDTSEYSQAEIDKAENAFLGYLEWESKHTIKILHSEIQVISEKYQFGGTIDFVGLIDEEFSLLDFKTGSGVYPEHKIQISAYGMAWDETHPSAKLKIKNYYLLSLNKNDGSFLPYYFNQKQLKSAFEVFKHLREIYDLKKEINN